MLREVNLFDVRMTLRAHMRALSERLGGVDGAALTLEARWGEPVSKSTISRMREGSLEWRLADAVAFEDALGAYPITQLLARRLDAAQAPAAGGLEQHAGGIARELGEAVSAVLVAAGSRSAEDRAAAIKELDEAEAVIRSARRTLEAGL